LRGIEGCTFQAAKFLAHACSASNLLPTTVCVARCRSPIGNLHLKLMCMTYRANPSKRAIDIQGTQAPGCSRQPIPQRENNCPMISIMVNCERKRPGVRYDYEVRDLFHPVHPETPLTEPWANQDLPTMQRALGWPRKMYSALLSSA